MRSALPKVATKLISCTRGKLVNETYVHNANSKALRCVSPDSLCSVAPAFSFHRTKKSNQMQHAIDVQRYGSYWHLKNKAGCCPFPERQLKGRHSNNHTHTSHFPPIIPHPDDPKHTRATEICRSHHPLCPSIPLIISEGIQQAFKKPIYPSGYHHSI